jgi:hypothetical protein
MNVSCAWLLLISAAFSVARLFGAEPLQWDHRVIAMNAEPHELVKAAFRFTNVSTKPVTFQSVEPSCDCTTARLTKHTFAPGEQGQIDIVYDVGDSMGPQFKTITVTLAENPHDSVELLLKVKIPGLIDITPRLLSWQAGEAPTEKSVDISLPTQPAVTVTGAKSKDPEMETRLETVVANQKYRLYVKPVSTDHPRRSTFVITTLTAGSEKPETNMIYGQVR